MSQETASASGAVNLLQRRVTPSRTGSGALAGVSVLVTGFSDDAEARKRCQMLVQQLGGTLVADLPLTSQASWISCTSIARWSSLGTACRYCLHAPGLVVP